MWESSQFSVLGSTGGQEKDKQTDKFRRIEGGLVTAHNRGMADKALTYKSRLKYSLIDI